MYTKRDIAWINRSLCLAVLLLSACHSSLNNPTQLIVHSNGDTLYQLVQQRDAHTSTLNTQLWALATTDSPPRIISSPSIETYIQSGSIQGIGWDSVRQRIIVSDARTGSIFTINPAVGRTTVLSSDSQGTGPSFQQLGPLVIDVASDRLVVIDQFPSSQGSTRLLSSVDLATGERTVISSSTSGLGPMEYGHALTLDEHQQQYYVAYQNGILAVDGFTGDRRRLSDAEMGIGMGDQWTQADSILLDAMGHRLLVTDSLQKKVYAVALATGDRTEIANWHALQGTDNTWGWSSVFNKDNLLVANQTDVGVLAIKISQKSEPEIALTPPSSENIVTTSSPKVANASVNTELTCLSFYLDFTQRRMLTFYQPDVLPFIYPIVFPIELIRSFVQIPVSGQQAVGCQSAFLVNYLYATFMLPAIALYIVLF